MPLPDGFYEWTKSETTPFYISLNDETPMVFAGLWETWNSPEGLVESCSIYTTDANDMMGRLHDRIPVILPMPMIGAWLDPRFSHTVALKAMLQRHSSDEMKAWEVAKAVGNVKNQGPELMELIEPPEPLEFKSVT